MKYFGYMPNDFINGEGICVSLWTAGCPHKCPGCHNPEMWDKEAGRELPPNIRGKIIKAISENGIQRNFSVLGGEPLVDYNLAFVLDIIKAVRTAYPNIKIFLWTGYTIEEINNSNYMIIKQGERMALNTPIQGTSADIIKKAMVEIHKYLKKHQLKSKMILQVHDELIIDCKKDELEDITNMLVSIMENTCKLDVPLKVDVNYGDNWYAAK